MEMGNRKKRILKSIVDEYIKTGEPVGSKAIVGTEGLEISSATLRGEMAELESMGYLDKPHVSAGRIPSDRGYREYVDSLMEKYTLTPEELQYLQSALMLTQIGYNSETLSSTVNTLSSALGYSAVVVSFKSSIIIIKKLDLIPLDNSIIAAVMIIGDGTVRSFNCRISDQTDTQKLALFCTLLNSSLSGKGINDPSDIDRMLNDTEFFREYTAIVAAIKKALYPDGDYSFYADGMSRLLNHPEYNDIKSLKGLVSAMEHKDEMAGLLRTVDENRPINVFIGGENNLDAYGCISIAAGCFFDGNTRSVMGVIGPKRMDYAKVFAALEFIIRLLNGSR